MTTKNKYPISKIPGSATNLGYRVRPRLLNPQTGKKVQICVQSVNWTESDARRECKRIMDLGPRYFEDIHNSELKKTDELEKNSKSHLKSEHKIKDARGNELITLDDLFERFMRSNFRGNKASYMEGQLINYRAHIKDVLGSKKLSELKKTDVAHWRDSLSNHTISKRGRNGGVGKKLLNTSKNRIIVTLKNILEYGNEYYDLDFDFIVKRFDIGDDTNRDAITYSIEQLGRFLSVIKQDNFLHFAFFLLLSSVGMRLSEVRALKETDIDFSEKELNIQRSIARNRGEVGWIESSTKSKKTRKVPLGDNTLTILKELIEISRKEHNYSPKTHYLFGGLTPYSANYIQYTFRRYREKACTIYSDLSNEFAIHDIRHSVATFTAKNSTPKSTQLLLGHSDISTTGKYIHDEPSRNVINTIDTGLHSTE
jgi:integrase